MHHQNNDVLILVLAIAGSLAVTTVAVLVAFRMRRRLFAGPARDQWDEDRRELSSRERRHVQWATMRRRPVSAAALAPAQLAYISFALDTVKRSPWTTTRWFRVLFPVLYVALAVLNAAGAIQSSQGRIVHFVLAAGFVILAVMFGFGMSRSIARQPVRLERLRAQINDRYGPASAMY